MLKTSIDELTVVLQATVSEKMTLENNADWQKLANEIIVEFEKTADLKNIFGERVKETSCPQGYTNGFCYGQHSFYFCIAYNESSYNMGIIVKFSAQSLAYYLKKTNQQVYSFLQTLKSDKYEFRLSRCDVDVDFMNEKFTPTQIFNDLKTEKVLVFYQKNQKNKLIFVRKHAKLQGFAINRDVPTVYVGSIASDCQLRIYDKKLEQIQQNGSKLAWVLQFDSVIRFEVALKHDLAHNITDLLLKVKNDKQLNDLVLSVFLQKFYFKRARTDKATLYTKKMQKALKGDQEYLLGHVNADNDLLQRFKYLLFSSGTISTLYKILAVYGYDDLDQALEYIKNFVQNWNVNDDCRFWLQKHADDTAETFDDFANLKQYLKEN
ncbi:replication initiation factor domain-containing protein [Lactobacillus amylovorus]|uniref:replication initiation factor domain-containing protein n=1 Tax=Lactobacillus amylovorus TaxID=1604 RepID=UPI0022E7A749|nr:replication initiation factor domain-containing protein [Lactobacillus amylovorus]